MTKYQIGVIGSRKLNLDNEKDKTAWDFAYKVGFSLGRAVNVIVLTCGMSGVAEAASKGAKEAGGVAVNLVPGFFKEEGSDEASVRIATLIENKEKSLPIVYSSDCLIALGGGEETGMQISQAVDLGLHVVIYSKAGGISSEVFTNLEPAFQKMRSSQLVYLVESPKEAVELAKKFAKEKISKNQRIEINEELQLSNKMQIITNEIQLGILSLLKNNEFLSIQEISNRLKIPTMIINAYIEKLKSNDFVISKKTLTEDLRYSLNYDNRFIQKLVSLMNVFYQDNITPNDSQEA